MKVCFPNPFGQEPASAQAVERLRDHFGISSAYAAFLLSQNGLLFDRLEASAEAARHLQGEARSSEGHSDLRVLYACDSSDPHYDLRDKLDEDFNIFNQLLFPIGAGYGGNLYAEVLAGKHKGAIVSLDHELYAASATLAEFCEEFALQDPTESSRAELADQLLEEDLGLAWFHAPDFQTFIEEGVHLDDGGCGFVVDQPS